MTGASPLILDRHEYKYLVPPDLLGDLRRAVRTACRRDRFAGADGLYTIRSLYLDTWDLRLFWANEREQGDRFKARIRCYPNAPFAPVFFEIKRRVQDTIYKTRVGLAPDRWSSILSDLSELDHVTWRSPLERRLAERFIYYVQVHHLEPAVLVEYEREAWVSDIDDYARATFDLHIRSQEPRGWSLDACSALWRHVDHPARTVTPQAVAIVELKFGRTAPPWMTALVRTFDLQRYAFSKYGYSVLELHQLPTTREATMARG